MKNPRITPLSPVGSKVKGNCLKKNQTPRAQAMMIGAASQP